MIAGAPRDRRDGRFRGWGWAALGVVTVVLSVRMDRLADQGVPPFAAPGLLPGLLGGLLALCGGLLAARRQVAPAGEGGPLGQRLLLAVGLCLLFSLGLVGHGLPFWLAAALFVATAILVLEGRGVGPRRLLVAGAIGLGAGWAATLVFQRVFLVQLP